MIHRSLTILLLIFGVALVALGYRYLSIRKDRLGIEAMQANEEKSSNQATPKNLKEAVFAGGCFWCVVKPFHKYDGVYSVVSGYTGGSTKNPTYEEVSTGRTGHIEAVKVSYDPEQISYEDLLEVFWRVIDPTDPGGQFNDRGSQYVPAIFYADEEQQAKAKSSIEELERSGRFKKKVAVKLLPSAEFYAAEDYHQDYYKKNPGHYEAYLVGSGRAGFIKESWGEEANYKIAEKPLPSKEELKEILDPLQYHVTQECGTEPPFRNKYWDNKEAGIYVDIISGEALFSSLDKFDSGSGWPSFTKPIDQGELATKVDESHGMTRVEVRSKDSDSHLGHVFEDGPGPDRKRYCINSAALRFVPLKDLEKEGYGQYLPLFEK